MPTITKFKSRDMDALSIVWKQLIVEDIPEVRKTNDLICVRLLENRFELKDVGEPKFPLNQKVVWFALSIAEENAEVEWLFSQIFHIVNKDRNGLSTHSIKGLRVTKSYIQTIGTCLNFKIDSSMMACINESHIKIVQRTTSDKNDDKCIHKRLLEYAKKILQGNKKIKTTEVKKMHIEKQEEAIKIELI
ncbi:unnamed protein product [Meganyctiphanes norvegica]|uniref:Uncharacterized protein n=1 Tax=Meganyctiphanes norvegica TaxID=48144 RepID=A0AAV2Q7P3_MEGNR